MAPEYVNSFGIDQQPREIEREAVGGLGGWIVDQDREFAVGEQIQILGQQLDGDELAHGSGLAEFVDRGFDVRRGAAVERHEKLRIERGRLEVVDEQLQHRALDRDAGRVEFDGERLRLSLIAHRLVRVTVVHGRHDGRARTDHDAIGSRGIIPFGQPGKPVRRCRLSGERIETGRPAEAEIVDVADLDE